MPQVALQVDAGAAFLVLRLLRGEKVLLACRVRGGSTVESGAMSRIPVLLTAALAMTVAASVSARSEDTSLSPPIACANGLIGGVNCVPTKKDLKESRAAFER